MEWTAESMDRLYGLYERHFDRLHADVTAVNRSLGSDTPAKTNLRHLTRTEFEALLIRPTEDPEPTLLWVKRIIRGHEHEFPEFDATSDSSRANCIDASSRFPRPVRRETGT